MYFQSSFDVAGPGLLFVAAGGILAMCAASAFIIVLEGIILWRLRWGTLLRSLLASFGMNFATSTIGLAVVPFTLPLGIPGLIIDLVLSILIEGLVLTLLKRGANRENWLGALIGNLASYLLVITPIYILIGLLK